MEHLMVVLGTRPEAIKLCPLVAALRKKERWRVTVCSTGQHREMLTDAMDAFDIKPDIELHLMQAGQGLSPLVAHIVSAMDGIYEKEKPDLVLVQGDTATAYGAALSAFHRQIPIAHVEAGLRTYHRDSPFPEEVYRQSISIMSSYHFAPTVTAKNNLVREGREENTVYITGNTVVDALRMTLGTEDGCIIRKTEADRHRRLIVFTAHRREHLGTPVEGMFRALRRLVETYPNTKAFCPLHSNPALRELAQKHFEGCPRIRLLPPLDVRRFHRLLSVSDLVMTDSGGIQEEATALGIPTVVMRHSSERTEGFRAGVLRLAGCHEDGIFSVASRLLEPNSPEYDAMRKPSAVYGDGSACKRIVSFLEKIS